MIKSLSLILCTKNAMLFSPKLIDKICNQKNIPPFELIIADTYSTDGSWEYIKSLKATKFKSLKLFRIKPKDFGHGKTRNELVKKAQGNIIVFFSQDIRISSNLWLYRLSKPLVKSEVGASFSRQIPYSDANIYDKFFYSQAYPDNDRIISGVEDLKFGAETIFFSMVSAAAKKNLLIKYPFVKDKDASVDQWWAKAILEKGKKIAYVSKSAVYHSHNYSLKELFKRNFYSGQSLIGFPKKSLILSLRDMFKYLTNEAFYLLQKRNLKDFLGMFIYESIRFGSFWLGNNWKLFR